MGIYSAPVQEVIKYAPPHAQMGSSVEAQARTLFEKLDVNGNGNISMDEFVALWATGQFVPPQIIEQQSASFVQQSTAYAQGTSAHIQEPPQYIHESVSYTQEQPQVMTYGAPTYTQYSRTICSPAPTVLPQTTTCMSDPQPVSSTATTFIPQTTTAASYAPSSMPIQTSGATATYAVVSLPVTASPRASGSLPTGGGSMALSGMGLQPSSSATNIGMASLGNMSRHVISHTSPSGSHNVPPPQSSANMSVQQVSYTSPSGSHSVPPHQPSQPITYGAPPAPANTQYFSGSAAPAFPQPSMSGVATTTSPRTSVTAPITYGAPPAPANAQNFSASTTPAPLPQPSMSGVATTTSPPSSNSPPVIYGAPAAPPDTHNVSASVTPAPCSQPSISYGAPSVSTSYSTAMTSSAAAPPMTPGTQMGAATSTQAITYSAPQQFTTSEAQQKRISEAGVQTETGTTAAASAGTATVFATPIPTSPKVSPRDNKNRIEFRNQVKEAVHQGEEMVTMPTEIAFGILEKGLPESDTSDLKPLKVNRGRRKGGCC